MFVNPTFHKFANRLIVSFKKASGKVAANKGFTVVQYNTMRCDAMRCDAVRCDAMRCDAVRCGATSFISNIEQNNISALQQ